MEETTNTFTGGLNQDLNPIATPDNVLTDAKNATFITFNGNEMSLQNDMGNTKLVYTDPTTSEQVEVSLPKNYIPIGLKEYGGILYIVSKNPGNSTGEEMIEIGSFPSPEFKALDEELLETKLTSIVENNTFSNSKLDTESATHVIETDELQPCDVISNYSFFPLNFEVISTEGERRIFNYKILNNASKKDITDQCSALNLKNRVQYLSYKIVNSDGTFAPKITVIFPNSNLTYTYVKGSGAGGDTPPDTFDTQFYLKDGCEYLAMYYFDPESDAEVQYTIGKGSRLVTKTFNQGGNQSFYYPNMQKGNMAFKFFTESIDYFNIIREEEGIIKYSPKLEKTPFTIPDTVLKSLIKTFSGMYYGKFFRTPSSPNYDYQVATLPTDGIVVPLQISGGAEFPNESDYLSEINNTKNRFGTLKYDATAVDKWTPEITYNAYSYKLKFEKIKITQPSWVKVNQIKFDWEIYSKNDLNTAVQQKSKTIEVQTYDNDTEFVISQLEIPIEDKNYRLKLSLFFTVEGPYKPAYFSRFLGSVVNEDTVMTIPFRTINAPVQSLNYIVNFTIKPINTEYGINLEKFTIKRSIDLTMSEDSWEGDFLEMDIQDTIPYTLENSVLKNDQNFVWLRNASNVNLVNTSLKKSSKFKITLDTANSTVTYGATKQINCTSATHNKKPSYAYYKTSFKEMNKANDNIHALHSSTSATLFKYFSWKGLLKLPEMTIYNDGNYDLKATQTITGHSTTDSRSIDGIIPRYLPTFPKMQTDVDCDTEFLDLSQVTYDLEFKRDTKHDTRIWAEYTRECEIEPTSLFYLGGYPSQEKVYASLYWINKNGNLLACDSKKAYIRQNDVVSTEIQLFPNCSTLADYITLVPTVTEGHSRITVNQQSTYEVGENPDGSFYTLAFYVNSNARFTLTSNTDMYMQEETTENDTFFTESPTAKAGDLLNISGNTALRYKRIVIICSAANIMSSKDKFRFTVQGSGTIYNPILYTTRLTSEDEGVSYICDDFRAQGMVLKTLSNGDLKFGNVKVNSEYVPLPHYEIVNT